MNRDTKRLADERFELLIVGGGITGACIARDAAMRGLKVALIEQRDFSHATSAHNSKLIHGGLRYLRNFELGLVRESLAERRIWQRIAPHLVSPLPFIIPLYGEGMKGRATLSAGLTLYDLLSYDRGWLADKAQRLPGHRFLDRKEALAREPSLAGKDFEGAFLYYDAQMYAPERLALECLMAAAAHGAACANYVAADGLLQHGGRVTGAAARDLLSGERFEIQAGQTLLAAGPWSDLFLGHALGRPSSTRLTRSKGIHLIVPAMTNTNALTVATRRGHFFVLPWRDHTILGTTDTAFTEPPGTAGVSEADIAGLLSFVNANLPHAGLTRGDVRHFYAGLRPLIADGKSNTYNASRKAELIDHGAQDGLPGLYSAIGGKWTTSRHLAQHCVDRIAEGAGRRLTPCVTATLRLPGGGIDDSAGFLQQARSAPGGVHLARMYGTKRDEVLSHSGGDASLLQPLSPSGDLGVQVLHAVRHEMAMTLEDVVMRRTGIGQLGAPDDAALTRICAWLAAELGWDETRVQREMSGLMRNFSTVADAA